jgi:hypothetical protein
MRVLANRLRRLESRLAAKIEAEQPGPCLHIVIKRIGGENREIFLPMRRTPGAKR